VQFLCVWIIIVGKRLCDGPITRPRNSTKCTQRLLKNLENREVLIVIDLSVYILRIYIYIYIKQRTGNSGVLLPILIFNLLTPSGFFTHHQVNIQKLYMVLALRWVFCTDLRINSNFLCKQHYLIGFYNRGGKRLLRSTNWFLIYSRLSSVFKRLIS